MKQSAVLFLALGILSAACASGGARSGGTVYQREIGTVTKPDFDRLSTLMLARWRYEVFQTDTVPFIRVETHWRVRPPFADEQALGVNAAESRVILTARVRGGEAGLGVSLYSLRMAVENRVRLTGTVDWNEKTNTPMFEEYANGLTEQFKTELVNIGVRR
jgi:hypothetical protein